eukprot:c17179_g1_i1.p1 GENE.c17179_g1_i1~~c17179_g1_i1.p1  ORF type:complete len:361 (+),score=168.47 c17179_g1_i1:23-1084(+)
MSVTQTKLEEKDLFVAFDNLDSDHDGFISIDTFFALISKSDEMFTYQKIWKVIKEIEPTTTDKVSFQLFSQVITKITNENGIDVIQQRSSVPFRASHVSEKRKVPTQSSFSSDQDFSGGDNVGSIKALSKPLLVPNGPPLPMSVSPPSSFPESPKLAILTSPSPSPTPTTQCEKPDRTTSLVLETPVPPQLHRIPLIEQNSIEQQTSSLANTVTCSGWLIKQTRNKKRWKRKWCELANNFIILYDKCHMDNPKAKQTEKISLSSTLIQKSQTIREEFYIFSSQSDKKIVFRKSFRGMSFKKKHFEFIFRAENGESCDEWINKIEMSIYLSTAQEEGAIKNMEEYVEKMKPFNE